MANKPSTTQFLMIHPIFIFILIITSNFLAELFPCRIQMLLKGNIFIKHLCGFLTLLFFAVLVDPSKQTNFNKMLLSSGILYIIFLVLINTNKTFFLVSLIILGLLYILNLKKIEISNELTEKEEIEKSNEMVNIQYIDYANKALMVIFGICTTIGFFVYMGEKKLEYKNDFNYVTFLFGKGECRKNSPTVSFTKALQIAFTK